MRRYLWLILLLMTATVTAWIVVGLADRATAAGMTAALQANQPLPESTTDAIISVCSQHPALCPVDGDGWQGEPDAWRKTGKQWVRHSGTPSSIDLMWEFSFPYQNGYPAWIGQQDNPYLDYTPPVPRVIEWERWAKDGDSYNYIMYQYAGDSEATSRFVGVNDCESGAYFPITNESRDYDHTPMSVTRQGQCISGGYMAAKRVELWGPPRSNSRIERCANAISGMPVEENHMANAMCIVSPFVGLVYQRYAWEKGPPPEDKYDLGCEAAIYAWGWPMPETAEKSGQQFEAWFRNGELRLSRWINLNPAGDVTTMPAADDDGWWNPRCEQAWLQLTNWLYQGSYQIGEVVYTDTISLPLQSEAVIDAGGGVLTSTWDSTTISFPAGTFGQVVTVTYSTHFQDVMTATDGLYSSNHVFDLAAVNISGGGPVQPSLPFTSTIKYSDAWLTPEVEASLALYYWDGDHWIREPTSTVQTDINTLVARPDHFSRWALLSEANRVFLPAATK